MNGKEALKTYFGYDAFKPGQEEVTSIAEGPAADEVTLDNNSGGIAATLRAHGIC